MHRHQLLRIALKTIISSPLGRARKTADILSQKINAPIYEDEGLKECRWGVIEGKLQDQSISFSSIKSESIKGYTPEGSESAVEFENRVIQSVQRILMFYEQPLIVSHSGIFWALMRHFKSAPLSCANCIPYFFRPPQNPTHPWFIYSFEKVENNL